MEIRETIRIEGRPFPAPLPAPAAEFVSVLNDHGYTCEDMGNNRAVMLNELFSPERLSEVEQLVRAEKWDVTVERSVWPVFDDSDYAMASLWVLRFPDFWIDEIEFPHSCEECGQKRVTTTVDVQVPKVGSKKAILTVNGQFEIVNADVRDAITESLTGACFHPFDKQGRYFYLAPPHSLGELICKEHECIDYRGRCSRCGLPMFAVFFGPLRYAKTRWSGQDIVHEAFHDGNLFTPKAFELLKAFEKGTSRDGVAFLE